MPSNAPNTTPATDRAKAASHASAPLAIDPTSPGRPTRSASLVRAARAVALTASASALLAAGATLDWPLPATADEKHAGAQLTASVARSAERLEERAFLSPQDLERGADRLWSVPRLALSRLNPGEPFKFLLPGGRTVSLPLRSKMPISTGDHASFAFDFGDPDLSASAHLTVSAAGVRGALHLSDPVAQQWLLRPSAADGSGASEWTLAGAHAGFGLPVTPPADADSEAAAGEGEGGVASTCLDDGRFIDVLVVGTADVAASFPGVGQLETLVDDEFAAVNEVNENSDILMRYRRAGDVLFVPNNTTGDIAQDLAFARSTGDSWGVDIALWRELARADLVVLLSGADDADFASYLNTNGNSADGFSAVSAETLGTGAIWLATALGYNLGACSASGDLEADGQSGSGQVPDICIDGGFFPYSRAWRFVNGTGARFATIMANRSADTTTIPHYSNYYVRYQGIRTGGSAAAGLQSGNNARTINLLSYLVANYRCISAAGVDCNGNGIDDDVEISAGLVPDCNGNGIPDGCDIGSGISFDADNNGVPDECQGALDPLELKAPPNFATNTPVPLNPGPSPTQVGSFPLDAFGMSIASAERPDLTNFYVALGAPGHDTIPRRSWDPPGQDGVLDPVGAFNAGSATVYEFGADLSAPVNAPAPRVTTLSPIRLNNEAADRLTNAYFGRAVDMMRRPASPLQAFPSYGARDYLVVGAYRQTNFVPVVDIVGQGCIHLYYRDVAPNGVPTTDWLPFARRFPGDNTTYAADNAFFGYSVAIAQASTEALPQMIVGGPGYDEGRGAVWIPYPNRETGGTTRFINPIGRRTLGTNSLPGDEFGASVDITSDVVLTASQSPRKIAIAGAPGANDQTGTVRVYEVFASAPASSNPATPVIPVSFPLSAVSFAVPVSSANFPNAVLQDGDRYGSDVAIVAIPPDAPAESGANGFVPRALAAVGAPGANGGRGRVHLFERGQSTTQLWVYRGYIDAPNAKPGDRFGASVAIAPSIIGGKMTIVVGAPDRDVSVLGANKDAAGAVFVFTRTPGSMGAQLAGPERVAQSPATGERFGWDVSAIRRRSLIGVPFADDQGLNSGTGRILRDP